MQEQYSVLYLTDPSAIAIPDTGKLRLFRSIIDNLYYVRKPDGSYELFGAGIPVPQASVTYAQLVALQTGNQLITGQNYLITDFRTRHIIPNTAVVNTGPIEPLIVTASNTNEISYRAFSTSFKQNILHYEIVDSTTAGGDRGRIYYRYDTQSGVASWYNWRVVLFRRWEDAPGSGIFTVLTNNGNAFADFYTFNNSASAVDCEQTSIDQITDFGIAILGAPTDKLNNIVFDAPCINNGFAQDNFNSTIIADIIAQNSTGVGFVGNTINAGVGQFVDNVVAPVFINNVIGAEFRENRIGFQFANNQIGDNFLQNLIGSNFFFNTIGNDFKRNIVRDDFALNLIGDFLEDNLIGSQAQANIIGMNFSVNQIFTKMQNNVIEDNFTSNIIGGAFDGNINIHNDFRRNQIRQGLSGVDFDLATHVYADYDKNIFKNSVAVYRLSYVDGADTVIYTATNA